MHVNTNHHCPRKTVTFADPLPVYKGHTFSTSLHLCNWYIDHYPKEGILSTVDSAASTDHFMPASYTSTNPQLTSWGVIVGRANGSHMCTTATDTLDLPQLPVNARGCHKFKDISLPPSQSPNYVALAARWISTRIKSLSQITGVLNWLQVNKTQHATSTWSKYHCEPQPWQYQPNTQLPREHTHYAPPRTSSNASMPQQDFPLGHIYKCH